MSYFLPDGYQTRPPRYFSDIKNTDNYQNEVYEHARAIYDENGYTSVLDIGTGSGYKLRKFFGVHERAVGTDVGNTLRWLRETYPDGQWDESSWNKIYKEPFDLLIAADIIEHLEDPTQMLQFIRKNLSIYGQVVFSTPDRGKLTGEYDRQLGPPRNGAHCQEWNFSEFHQFILSQLQVREHFHVALNTQVLTASL